MKKVFQELVEGFREFYEFKMVFAMILLFLIMTLFIGIAFSH
jgi:hypothetical protein